MTLQPVISRFEAGWHPSLKPAEKTDCKKRVEAIWTAVYFLISLIIFPIGLARLIGLGIAHYAKKITLPAAWMLKPEEQEIRRKRFLANCTEALSRDDFDTYTITFHATQADGSTEVIRRRYKDGILLEGPEPDNSPIQTTFNINEHIVQTPDGANLRTVHFRHKQADAHTPTLIYCQPNGATVDGMAYKWLIEKSMDRKVPLNLVTFDYRTVGQSKGQLSEAKDLITDAESVYQFVRDSLQIPPDQIHMYGFSLGGVVAATVNGLHPCENQMLISERSLSSSKAVAREWIQRAVPRWLAPLLSWLPWAMEVQKWNLEVPYRSLSGRTLAIYHPNDGIIPLDSSFHTGAIQARAAVESINLERKQNDGSSSYAHHSNPLSAYKVRGTDQNADEAVADFLLQPAALPIAVGET
jgi:alpha/beta superfamily hydrolase